MLLKLEEGISKTISKEFGIPIQAVMNSFSIPRGEFGDLSTNIAFEIAGKEKRNPAGISPEISRIIGKNKYVEKAVPAGPYVNLHLKDTFYSDALKGIMKEGPDFGKGKKKRKKVMVEFPSVNPNKPWHIGHLRNAILGNSVANLLEFYGYNVERTDYIDDLGLQVAQSLWGYLNIDSKPDKKFDQWLGERYVEVSERFENDEKVSSEVKGMLKEMEEGKSEVAKKARWLAEECVKSQYDTSFQYAIYHDVLIFESDIMRTVFTEGLEYLKKNGAIKFETSGENKGCWVVRLAGEFSAMKNPDKILIRSDGTVTYTGKDVIFHLWKFGKLKNDFEYSAFIKQPNGKTAYMTSNRGKKMKFGKVDMVVNVIGVEQTYPQKVIAEVFRRLNFSKEADNYVHLAYEHADLPEQSLSGRKGTWLGYTADELITEAKSRVIEKIKAEYPDKEKAGIAALVGDGAIKFSFLRPNADKKFIFKWEEALNMEGDSGPFLQYAYVRARGILEKSGLKPAVTAYHYNSEEKKLIKSLAGFPQVVEKGAVSFKPNTILEYLLDLSSVFSSFYASNRVLGEEENVTRNRLAMVYCAGIVLKNGLSLMGVRCPERM